MSEGASAFVLDKATDAAVEANYFIEVCKEIVIVIVIVIVIFKQGFHSVKNTDFQWSPAKQAYIHTYTNTYVTGPAIIGHVGT